MNEEREQAGEPLFANPATPRPAPSTLDSAAVARRGLRAFVPGGAGRREPIATRQMLSGWRSGAVRRAHWRRCLGVGH
jgi:hypothetical protein